jgi:hypothetical protein
MPRRRKTFIGPGKALVNGGRFDVAADPGDGRPVAIAREVEVDTEAIRRKVEKHIQQFDELTQLADRDQFIQDIVTECTGALTMHLDYLFKGADTKPDQWMAQILACGLATVMRKHGLRVTVSEYEKTGGNTRVFVQSLYLRLIPRLIKICFPVPKDVRGLARRAMRIKHKVFAISPTRHGLEAGRGDAAPVHETSIERLKALIEAYGELDDKLKEHPAGRQTIGRLRAAVCQKLEDDQISEYVIKHDIELVRPILRLVQRGVIPSTGRSIRRTEPSEKTRQEMAAGKAALARIAAKGIS